MELKLIRETYTKNSTIGALRINGTFFCYTLEDTCRDLNRDGDLNDSGEAKVYGETCIPAGRYKVIINMSNRFKRKMPLLLNVPGYDGIRMHNGVEPKHTLGCLLVGAKKGVDKLFESKDTFEKLMLRLTMGVKPGEEIFITIVDQPVAAA